MKNIRAYLSMKGSKVVFTVCLLVSIGMLVTGFIIPPTGVIDGSVLKAVGELFGFAALGQLPSLVRGNKVQMKHGNTEINIEDKDETD